MARLTWFLLVLAAAVGAWLALRGPEDEPREPGGHRREGRAPGRGGARLSPGRVRPGAEADATVIEGVVTLDGRPVAADVLLRPLRGLPLPDEPEGRVTGLTETAFLSDVSVRSEVVKEAVAPEGAFCFQGLAPGAWVVEARAAALGPPGSLPSSLSASPQELQMIVRLYSSISTRLVRISSEITTVEYDVFQRAKQTPFVPASTDEHEDVLHRISKCSEVAKLTPHGWKKHFQAEVAAKRNQVLELLDGST